MFAQGLAAEFDGFGAVDEAVEDGVGEGRIVELGVPEFERQLAGDDEAAALVAVFEEFEQQGLMDGGERDEAEVIEDEQVDAALGFEPMAEAALGVDGGEFVGEARQAQVADGLLLVDGGLGEGAGEIAFADAGGAEQQEVVVLAQPVEAEQGVPAGFAEAARGAQVDVGGMGVLGEFGEFQAPGLGKAVAMQGLGLEQEREGIEECVVGLQPDEGVGGAAQAEAGELGMQGFMQHGGAPG